MAQLTLLLALAGCGHNADSGHFSSYVALGDSYTSGAGLPEPVTDAGACAQSKLSYPFLVAKELHVEQLIDVSCGGATTESATVPQQRTDGPWAPQLQPVKRSTDLVTVSLGGNDFRWYLDVMFGCTSAAAADPTGNPCEQANPPGAGVTLLPAQIGDRLKALLTEVHRRAPDARVVLVGYPQPVPAEGSCPELPLAKGDYPFVRAQWEALDAAMRKAAVAAKATYVSVLDPSEGHDICAGDDAWVNGVTDRPGVASAYHPLQQEQTEVARLVERALRE